MIYRFTSVRLRGGARTLINSTGPVDAYVSAPSAATAAATLADVLQSGVRPDQVTPTTGDRIATALNRAGLLFPSRVTSSDTPVAYLFAQGGERVLHATRHGVQLVGHLRDNGDELLFHAWRPGGRK